MLATLQHCAANLLLGAVSAEARERLVTDLKLVDLEAGQVLAEPNVTMRFVYFPTTAIVSLMYVLDTGASAEAAVIGNEGIVGISLFMGDGSTTSMTVVQSAGQAFRLPAAALKREFERGGTAMQMLLRFTQALMAQMTQTAACNRHHSLHQQLCRLLLLSHDRVPGNELFMTHELIAYILGVRRESVSEAASKLKKAQTIRYARGRITVLDRTGLERCTCECYAVVKDEYDRLLPHSDLPSLARHDAAFEAARAKLH